MPKQEKNIKTCAVCGKPFPCSPSDKTVTCSKACSKVWRSRVHIGKRNAWNSASREKLREQGQTENLKTGTAAALLSPKSGPFETNINAKHWVLKAPDQTIHEFDNLSLFIREHPDWFPNPKSARTALSGIATGRIKNLSQYKGWQVIGQREKQEQPSDAMRREFGEPEGSGGQS